MELKLLRSFISVATLKSFSAAARELNTVQPAISRHISELEEELGVSLLWRSTREVKITEAGKCLLEDAKIIINQELLAKENTKKTATGQIGNIKIGYIGSACFTFLPELIRSYNNLFPDVKIRLYEMSVQEQIEAFKNNSIDIGISRELPKNTNLDLATDVLYMDQLFVVVHDSHKFATYKEINLEQISLEDFILFNKNEAPLIYNKIMDECLKHSFVPNIISQPKTMQTVITEVTSEIGISIVPGCIKRLYTNGCVFIPIKNHEADIKTEIQYGINPISPVVESFIELTLKHKDMIRNSLN